MVTEFKKASNIPSFKSARIMKYPG